MASFAESQCFSKSHIALAPDPGQADEAGKHRRTIAFICSTCSIVSSMQSHFGEKLPGVTGNHRLPYYNDKGNFERGDTLLFRVRDTTKVPVNMIL